MKLIVAALILLAATFTIAMMPSGASSKYVCIPCGRECDATLFSEAGSCKACGMKLVDAQTIKFKGINFQELCMRIKSNKEIVLLDVRSPDEFNNNLHGGAAFGRFKNAININIRELPDRLSEIEKYKDKEVIVYCSHSHRSPEASYYLTTHGFNNVTNLLGGVSALTDQNDLNCLKSNYISFQDK